MRIEKSIESSGYAGVELIIRLRNSDPGVMDLIYNEHKNSAFFHMKKMSNQEEILEDVYQDAMVAVYKKSLDPDFELTCDFQGYINTVCKNQLLNRLKIEEKQREIQSGNHILRKQKSNADLSERYNEANTSSRPNTIKEIAEEDIMPLNIDNINVFNLVKTKMKDLSEKCYEIINRTFLMGESNEFVSDALDFKDKIVFKNIKARCLRDLKLKALKLKIHS